jgi:hypothetical protein
MYTSGGKLFIWMLITYPKNNLFLKQSGEEPIYFVCSVQRTKETFVDQILNFQILIT